MFRSSWGPLVTKPSVAQPLSGPPVKPESQQPEPQGVKKLRAGVTLDAGTETSQALPAPGLDVVPRLDLGASTEAGAAPV